MWNDAGCNCDDVRTVLTHDATFEHYARVASGLSPQRRVAENRLRKNPKRREPTASSCTATAIGRRRRGTSTRRCPHVTSHRGSNPGRRDVPELPRTLAQVRVGVHRG